MPTVNCQQCDESFYSKPNRIVRGWGKYCSNSCKHLALNTGTFIPCDLCKKPSYKSLKDQRRSKSGKFFCSKSCQTKWRNSEVYVGDKHKSWQGGESVYRDILRRAKVAQVCSKCENTDKRILAVHHKDKNRKNNGVSNLVWLCHNCHFLVHHYKNEARKFVVPVA